MANQQIESKRLFISTYGCQMNVYDSVQMSSVLKERGYLLTENIAEADLVILNTCNIREKAVEKVYSELGRIRELKEVKVKNNQSMIIAVAGCVGQAEGDEIFQRAPYVDIVVGPQSYQTLPDLIWKINNNYTRVSNLEFASVDKFDSLPEESLPQGISAFLTIQEGCNQFCKFCAVPYTRGAEFSRPVAQIYREAIKLVNQGSREITLLGQNVNAYHGQADAGETFSLAKLIQLLSTIKALTRIRYITSHPLDMSQELIDLHGNEPKLMPSLHLPIQSGSNRILEAMNRKHSGEFYLEIIENSRKSRPDMAFSSDFIVGYPGESEEDFEETLRIIRQVKFSQSFSFKYSKRFGTPAALMEDQVPEEIKSRRLSELQYLLIEQQKDYNKSFIGKEVEVLIEKVIENRGQVSGKTPYMQNVYIEGSRDLYGKTIMVKILDANQTNLKGQII